MRSNKSASKSSIKASGYLLGFLAAGATKAVRWILRFGVMTAFHSIIFAGIKRIEGPGLMNIARAF